VASRTGPRGGQTSPANSLAPGDETADRLSENDGSPLSASRSSRGSSRPRGALRVNGSYGYFRDELYFIVCGRHPAWGYTDQPPLMPLIAAGSDAAFHSLRGLRLIPALAAAATVALTASAAQMLEGRLYARWLAVGPARGIRPDALALSRSF
jgi:hypothetical protein